MYHIYHTEGIILASIGTGEADRFLHVLTPDFGLIGVVARGSRLMRSKMKYHLTEYRRVTIDIVRGKNVWTLTGIQPQRKEARTPESYAQYAELSAFLRRLIKGEEGNELLFAVAAMGIDLITRTDSMEEKKHALLAGKYAILSALGYAEESVAVEYATGALPEKEISHLEDNIHASLAESHL
jgi:recombinational DNA repair protein (RecF pathway)